MDFPFLNFHHMMSAMRTKDAIEVIVSEAVSKLTLGTFHRKDGEIFREVLTNELNLFSDFDNDDMQLFLYIRLSIFAEQQYPSDIPSLFGVLRYILSCFSLVEFTCIFDGKDEDRPVTKVKCNFVYVLNKVVLQLKEKATVQKFRDTMKEFCNIAEEAYTKGYNAAAHYISNRVFGLILDIDKTSTFKTHPILVDVGILKLKSLDFVEFADYILSQSKQVPPVDMNLNQHAQILQLQAEVYDVKDIYSLAIQRGKEARDKFQTDKDKEMMKRFINRIEEKQREKDRGRPTKKNTETVVETDMEPNENNEDYKYAAEVFDEHVDQLVENAEYLLMTGKFDSIAAKQFHDDINKYLFNQHENNKVNTVPSQIVTEGLLLVRVFQNLDSLTKDLSEESEFWLGIQRYIFHVMSLLGCTCHWLKSTTDKPDVVLNVCVSDIYDRSFQNVILRQQNLQDVISSVAELTEIAKLALKYGNNGSCYFMTDAIIRLQTMNISSEKDIIEQLPDLFILHIKSVDMQLFPAYVIQVCETASTFTTATRKDKGILYELEARALKVKQDYKQAVRKAKLSEANFQDDVDKQRLVKLIEEFDELNTSPSSGTIVNEPHQN